MSKAMAGPMSGRGAPAAAQGKKAKQDNSGPVFFWREYEMPYGFLSQWYPCSFTETTTASSTSSQAQAASSSQSESAAAAQPPEATTIRYNSTEQYMMHAKALSFPTTFPNTSDRSPAPQYSPHNQRLAKAILATSSPREQKMLGRKVSNYSAEIWEPKRYDVVLQGNMLKFSQAATTFPDKNGVGISLKTLLLKTGDRELVEASPQDRIWGVGFAAHEAEQRRSEWGENLLGKVLMDVRARLRGEEEGSTTEEAP